MSGSDTCSAVPGGQSMSSEKRLWKPNCSLRGRQTGSPMHSRCEISRVDRACGTSRTILGFKRLSVSMRKWAVRCVSLAVKGCGAVS
eukprot:1847439-Rhodomonas_salina.2